MTDAASTTGGTSPVVLHPPGRRRLRSAVRDDGYETWTILESQYTLLREVMLRTVEEFDDGNGVLEATLVEAASRRLHGHPDFPSGRFGNWVRFVRVDLECEGVLTRVPNANPHRVRLAEAR